MATELCFDLLGTRFSINVDKDKAYLQNILNQYLDAVENTQSISGLKDPLNIAILTGYLLCDEINEMRLMKNGEEKEAEERALSLIAKIDKALEKAPAGKGSG